MSNPRHALFDPRRPSQMWPEPNDDPNIPYAWGLNGLGYTLPITLADDVKVSKVEVDFLIGDLISCARKIRNITEKNQIITVTLFPNEFRTAVDQPLITPQTLYLAFINETIAALEDSKKTTDAEFINSYRNAIDIRALCDQITLDATPTPPNALFNSNEIEITIEELRKTCELADQAFGISDEGLSKSRTLLNELTHADLMTQQEYTSALTDAFTEMRSLYSEMNKISSQFPKDPSDPAPPPPAEEKPSSLGFWILGAAALGIGATIWFVRKEDLRTRTTTEFKARKW